jgi:hypothetical protein
MVALGGIALVFLPGPDPRQEGSAMSGWELFTWFNVGVLAIDSVIVFLLFLRQLSQLLPPRSARRDRPV